MKKKILAALLSMAVMTSMCTSTAFAAQNTGAGAAASSSAEEIITYTDASGYSYTLNDDGTARIAGYVNSNATSLTIPSVIGGKTVTHIEDYAFRDYSKLRTVTMGDTIVDIGICAFSNCTSLQSVTFSKALVHLSVYAFENCTSLTEVALPDTVETIFTGVFQGCTNLKKFHIPASLTFVSKGNLFENCPKITTLTFSSYIDMTSSYDSENMLDSDHLYIPPSVTEIIVDGGKLSFTHTDSRTLYITGFSGTYAEQFANSQGIPFIPILPNSLGDVDGDEVVNSVDASMILTIYAAFSTGSTVDLDVTQLQAADADRDNTINSVDASKVLSYYAFVSTGGTGTFEQYMA